MKTLRPTTRLPRLLPSYTCARCRLLSNHKSYSTSTTNSSLPASGAAHLTNRRLILLHGPHAQSFLQGAITANTTKSPRTGFYAAFLNAQGRVFNDVFIYPLHANTSATSRAVLGPLDPNGEGYLIEVDAEQAEGLFKRIKRYKLRSVFTVRLLAPEEAAVWSVWEDKSVDAGWTAHSLPETPDEQRDGISCVDARAPGMGRRVILSGSQKPEGVPEVELRDYTVRRMLRGVAEGQGEILKEAALVQESNIDFMGGVDYRKGCYVGQELTIRTHHTGVVRKRILPVMVYGAEEVLPTQLEYRPEWKGELPPPETSISRFGKKGRSAGKWLGGVGNVGLGLCRLEIMTGTVVQGEGAGWKEGDEFKVEWEAADGEGRVVKVRAFVPPWHLTKQ